jgi:hypothetical protein
MESPYPEAVVTVVEKPTTEAAGGSSMQDTALVVVSTSLPLLVFLTSLRTKLSSLA